MNGGPEATLMFSEVEYPPIVTVESVPTAIASARSNVEAPLATVSTRDSLPSRCTLEQRRLRLQRCALLRLTIGSSQPSAKTRLRELYSMTSEGQNSRSWRHYSTTHIQ
jgi:hypothetical protein